MKGTRLSYSDISLFCQRKGKLGTSVPVVLDAAINSAQLTLGLGTSESDFQNNFLFPCHQIFSR